jgi:phosphofructokinase-like protein
MTGSGARPVGTPYWVFVAYSERQIDAICGMHHDGVMKIGILTSGGDAPGLNAVIRGIVYTGIATQKCEEFVGFRSGWKGVVDGDLMPLGRHEIKGIHKQGGTILGTSRTNPFDGNGGVDRINEVMRENNIDAIIAIGGEGTLAAAKRLTDAGINIVGVPKTVDNDLSATDYTFGFDTAVQIATDAMDRLRTTGDSHGRCMIAEVMGRHVGWIALHSGMAAGAHAILIPEQKTSVDQIIEWVTSAHDRGRAPLVVVAEGFALDSMDDAHSERGLDAFGRPRLGGIGELLAPIIEERTGIETRATTLGHIQRGGTPSAYDRVLATRLGMAALDAAIAGDWGHMVGLRGTEIITVPFADALGQLKTVPQSRYDEARILFG